MAELHKRRIRASMDHLKSCPENLEIFKKYGISEEELKTETGLSASNVTVAQGGTGAHGALTSTFLQAGDEVILFEPMFLWYPQLENIGVEVKFSTFLFDESTGSYKVNLEQLKSLVTDKTKMILIINPNNPNGKTFSLEEMLEIRKICLENPQIFIMSDEVYTLFMYDGNQQVCISSLPDMFERTVTINSQGKEFSCTGWRMGTLTGPEYLVKPVGEFLKFQQGGANN